MLVNIIVTKISFTKKEVENLFAKIRHSFSEKLSKEPCCICYDILITLRKTLIQHRSPKSSLVRPGYNHTIYVYFKA